MLELTPYIRHAHRGYDPFRFMEAFERSFFADNVGSFRTDVRETADAWLVEADLPGVKKEDIALEINGDTLTVKAERTASVEEKDSGDRYVRRERRWGSFARSFDVSGIDTDNIKATYNDGVLCLTLPKKVQEAPAVRRLEIQ